MAKNPVAAGKQMLGWQIASFVVGLIFICYSWHPGEPSSAVANSVEISVGSIFISAGLFWRLPTKWFRWLCMVGFATGLAIFIIFFLFMSDWQ